MVLKKLGIRMIIKDLKDKKCRWCKNYFSPRSSLQIVCSPSCSLAYTKEKTRKKTMREKEKNTKILEEYAKDYKKLSWKQISKYVRYTISEKDDQGRVKCYTCPKVMPPEESDCGHFEHDKLDDDLRNFKIQCSKCNRYLSGNLAEYRKNLVRDFGEEWVQQLERDAQECKPKKNHEWKETYIKFKSLNKEHK